VIIINTSKPDDFTFKQARLRLGSEELWKLLALLVGPRVIASFKLAFHPLYLCPDYLNPSDFQKGSNKANSRIVIGARYNHFSIAKRMWWIVEKVT
jgi:hypothetical protein